MTSSAEQERQLLAALEQARPEDRPAGIDLVYYDEVSWAHLRSDDEGTLEDHTRSMDRIGRRVAELGIDVAVTVLEIDVYRDWLGNRKDSPDRRAEFAAGVQHSRQPRYRLGMKIDTNLISWCLIGEDNRGRLGKPIDGRQNHVSGADVLKRLRQPGESQRDFADRIGVNVRTLQRIHSGKEIPPLSLVVKALGRRR